MGIQIGLQGLVFVFAIGAAVLALWVDTRFPKLSPKSVGYAFLHVAGAFVACRTAPLGVSLTAERGTLAGMMAALFLVGLPIFLYVWLSLLWMTKLLTSALKSRYG